MRNLEDIEAFETTSWQDRCSGQTTYELISHSAARFSDRPALKFQITASVDEPPLEVSYRELLEKINQTANALYSAGVSVGGVTSIILPNLPQNHYSLWGGEALGIAGPINSMLEPVALRDIMIESGTQALVVFGPIPGSDIWEKTIGIVDQVPSMKAVFQVNLLGADKDGATQTPGGLPIFDFDTQLQQQPADALVFQRDTQPEDIATYFHTGGTTGTPKIAQLSHRNQVFVASVIADQYSYDESTVAICGLPLFHVNAVFVTGLNVFARGGQTVLLSPAGFRTPGIVDNLWQLISKYQATFFSTVPTIVSALLKTVPEDKSLMDTMQFVACGAAPIAPETLRQFTELTGITVLEGYGMTEATCTSALNPEHGERRVGSIGLRLPYQAMKCVVLDEEGGYQRDCELEESGVIVVKGPNVFSGYKNVANNRGAFIGDWLVTGDLARQDKDGYFWLTGRAKDLIIRGGHNIDPKVIEDVLSNHPAVELVAAIGQPDAYAGELPCAYVTVNTNSDVGVDELMEYVRQEIPERAAIPVYLEMIESMPVTAVGKIFKPALRNLAIERVLNAAICAAGHSAGVSVGSDDKLGVLACIDKPSDKLGIKSVLDLFTVAYEYSDA